MAVAHCILGNFLGVVCHCFPPNPGITEHIIEWSARLPSRKVTVQVCTRRPVIPTAFFFLFVCLFVFSPPGRAKAQLQIRRPASLDIVLNYPPILARGVVWRIELTPKSAALPEKLTVPQLVKIFPAFYGTQMFITAFTVVLARSLHSPPSHRVSWGFILLILQLQPEVFQVITFL